MFKTWAFCWRWKRNWLLKHHAGVIKAGQLILSRWQKVKDVFIWKNKSGFRVCRSDRHVLLLQTFLIQNSMIDLGSRLCDVWPVNCCTVARGNFLLQSIQTVCEPHSLLVTGYLRLLSLVVKWPWHEADHWPPCSAENKNVWSCFSTPHVSCSCAHGQLYFLLLLLSRTSKFVCQLMGICWRTNCYNDRANKLWAVFVPLSWLC